MDVINLIKNLKQILRTANNERHLIELKNIFVKQHLLPLYDELKKSTNKKEMGLLINNFKQQIEFVTDQILKELNNKDDQVDLKKWTNKTLFTPFINNGHHHILNSIIDDIASFFKKLNFEIVSGPEVVSPIYNFDHLNIDENHPARASADSFFINSIKMLRTHCTTTTAQFLENNVNKDIRIMSFGNVYRKDDDDATHSHQFNQVDFVWVKEGLTVANLKWLIDSLIKYLFGQNLKTRYRLSFFPFTEPSFEVDVQCFKCDLKGCAVCKKSTWIEIMGTGMLHENVLKAANINDIRTGMAFGVGIDRIAMLKYEIDDIRYLYSNNFKFNAQIK
ncbi:phenylalanyl-tRNA synthetase, alpha subunit [Ureaplasma parvum serovar 14 str. ATCC 33697]|uniref:phenylalanine--tRNA ligase subunit alpha n=1 Tax=Ureaplasma parvum TaxID=134821 RepID=UPI00017250D3|nr:phenylalanine--tRNA ligase subunit alpha [Ureaplasma parvum]EDT87981.1 phenylalanyl-tRNA synthetase, alpha subunit [Ureaplasma parvum serovar 14 str. ATCC 33697]MDU7891533.1 phenylalanine--tRNA ligase subunit alpha [Ureaplasma parvum]